MAEEKKKKKVEAAQEGAPLWCIVYADLMTQLMAFFVMLFAMGEIKSDKGRTITQSMHVAFHRRVEGGSSGVRATTGVARVEGAIPTAIEGADVRVVTLREGKMMVIGGKVLFEKGSAQLLPQGRRILGEQADIVKGYRNRLEIRGHASQGEISAGSPFADEWELSWHRAKAVADFLSRVGKIPEGRLRITGSSFYDPAAVSLLSDDEDSRNRRVEIVEVGELVP
jgi:chemotaxis protein MotB